MAKVKKIHQIIVSLDQQINQLIDIKADLALLLNDTEDRKSKSETTPMITLESVRAVLADKSRLGFTKDIKAILVEFGASKLSEVKPKDYAEVLKKAEVLGNE